MGKELMIALHKNRHVESSAGKSFGTMPTSEPFVCHSISALGLLLDIILWASTQNSGGS